MSKIFCIFATNFKVMSKKKIVILIALIVETILLFVMTANYISTKQLLNESIKTNQELLDAYKQHNETFHCNL
jgi:hypothetical protein